MGDKEDIRDVLPEELRLEDNIPEELCYDIVEQARGNEHYSCVYRVAKWGKIEERAFLNTYGEIQEGYILDDDGKYPKDNIGTYSTSVYTERKNCDKFINMLKKSVRLRKVYPFPVIIVGNTSNGLVQRTADRDVNYPDPTHVDWWLFSGKKGTVLSNFVLCE